MTDEKLYWRIHLNNGEVWFCQKFGPVQEIVSPEKWESWMNVDSDFAMIGAVIQSHVDVTDTAPSPMVVIPSPVKGNPKKQYVANAVEKLSVPRLSGYHLYLENHLKDFA
jgi:hypothetical protein